MKTKFIYFLESFHTRYLINLFFPIRLSLTGRFFYNYDNAEQFMG